MNGSEIMIGFVILNYNSYNDTINCIKQLQKLEGEKRILVVDNNSLTKTEIEKLQKLKIDLLLLEKNYGYAQGNNKGCQYLIDRYNQKIDYICVLNSDVIITDKNFIQKVEKDYEEYQFDILGTRILPEDSESCNPFPVFDTLTKVEDEIKYLKKLRFIYKNKILRYILKQYIKLKHTWMKPLVKKVTNGEKLQKNIALHGCLMVFSKKYYLRFHEIFYPETFLFHEEEFIYYRVKKNNLITIYDPKIEIIHLEGQSINQIIQDDYQKKIFKINEQLKSLEKLTEVMKNNNLWR